MKYKKHLPSLQQLESRALLRVSADEWLKPKERIATMMMALVTIAGLIAIPLLSVIVLFRNILKEPNDQVGQVRFCKGH